ncbi:MAG: hypothetical protein M1833_001589 [Piccolia ochrophora]|nr:MAG: hypothetical protein M1833_001589 [Piccolia ochrophora]
MDLSSLRVDPKYLNEDRGPYLRRILITLFVLGFVFVALRMTARRIAKIPLMYDDYMLIFILVMYLGTTILAGFVRPRKALVDA